MQAPQGAGNTYSTYPLTPAYAKRLAGLLMAAGGVPVTWQGRKLVAVQRKRHVYDDWTKVTLAGNVDTTNTSARYRALCHNTPSAKHLLSATKDLVNESSI